MRDRYDWYIGPTEDEIERIWSDGILTVDANVLLDLYRYHDMTREKLLGALEHFSGRAWLSSQAAEEFVRNRSSVIASAAKTFSLAEGSLGDLSKSVETAVVRLRGYRLITREVAEFLNSSIKDSIATAAESIEKSKSSYPNYFGRDPILARIFDLFDESVGSPPQGDELDKIKAEAKHRIEKEIPPGYLDSDKEGYRSSGDYFLWHEVLSQAKQRESPVILVTSERKEDWWEMHSGRTVGPRPELLQESSTVAGQRILIYQTEFFLERYSGRAGETVDAEVVDEIRKLSSEREHVPAVSVHQRPTSASLSYNEGYLTIHLSRPVYTATGSGRLEPNMRASPKVWVELLESPEEKPKVRIGAGTGTNFDFNIHINSSEYNVPLPKGDYKFMYRASLPNSSSISISEENQEMFERLVNWAQDQADAGDESLKLSDSSPEDEEA